MLYISKSRDCSELRCSTKASKTGPVGIIEYVNLRCLSTDFVFSMLFKKSGNDLNGRRIPKYFISTDSRLWRREYPMTSLLVILGQWAFKLRRKTIGLRPKKFVGFELSSVGKSMNLPALDPFELLKTNFATWVHEPTDP